MSLAMLMSVFALAVNAVVQKPTLTKQLPYLTAKPAAKPNYGLTRLSEGLTSSPLYTKDYWGNKTSFTEDEKKDLADMSKYSLTIHGVRALERPADAAVDNVFSVGSTGSGLENGSKRNGGFAGYADGQTYNLNGETGKSDSIYRMIMTLDLEKQSAMDYLVFLGGDNSMPNAADIYVSDDGQTWKAVGYYDLIQDRMNGLTIQWLGGGDFTDSLGSTGGSVNANIIDLGNGVVGRYIRICATALRKSDSFSTSGPYDSNVNNAGEIVVREIMVLGSPVAKPTANNKLEIQEAWPTDYAAMSKISEGLTSFNGTTSGYWNEPKGFNFTPFNAEQKKEMADMSKYGITAYGIAGAERALSAMTDGYFNNNIAGKGSYGFYWDDQTYNYKGETGKADSIYQSVITMNFGEVYNLEYLTFLSGNNQIAAAADLYISNDGENWTAIGYYDVLEDLIAMVKEGSDSNVGIWGGSQYNLTDLYGDKSGGTGTNFNHVWIDLGNVQAQYLRICNTTAALTKTGTAVDVNNYGANLSNTTQVCGREMIVWGTGVDVTYEGVQLSNADANGSYDARFLADLEGQDYTSAGFEMDMTYYTAENTTGVSSGAHEYGVTTAYGMINIFNTSVETPYAGHYFIALTIDDIPAEVTKLEVKVRAYAVKTTGEKVYSNWYLVTLVAGQTPVTEKL